MGKTHPLLNKKAHIEIFLFVFSRKNLREHGTENLHSFPTRLTFYDLIFFYCFVIYFFFFWRQKNNKKNKKKCFLLDFFFPLELKKENIKVQHRRQ